MNMIFCVTARAGITPSGAYSTAGRTQRFRMNILSSAMNILSSGCMFSAQSAQRVCGLGTFDAMDVNSMCKQTAPMYWDSVCVP
jgi:hypothetical protein